MEFLDLAQQRYSVRKFDTRKVEDEKVNAILESARVAPTAANLQPQRILVIDSEEGLESIKQCTPYHFNSPLAILVCYDKSASWKRTSFDGKDMGEVDASIVATHIMLEVESIGLGTTWVAYFDPQKISKLFSIPDGIEPVAIFPIGYPHEDSKPSQNHFKRLELDKTVFRNTF